MKRVLTAAILAPLVLFIVLKGPYWALFALVALFAALCYYEFGAIAKLRAPERLLGIAAGTLLLKVRPDQAWQLLLLFAILTLVMAVKFRELTEILPIAAAQSFGLLYIYAAWNTAFLLWALNPYWLAFGLVVNWVGDTGAYYFGRRFGKHKLAPLVSPGKTWEGSFASIGAAVLFALIFLTRTIPGVKIWQIVLVAIAANAAGQLGDLAESGLKRGAGVKDSGTLMPGHGGVLDRVDSTLFSLPVLYGLLYLIAV